MTRTVEVAGIGIHPVRPVRGPDRHRAGRHRGAGGARARPVTRSSRPRSAAPPTPASPPGHKVLGALGRTGMPIVDVEAGCASGGAALMLAGGAIRAGQYDCVLVFGIEKMPKRDHPVVVLRALARGSRARGDARLLRTARPASHARVGRHEGPARRGRREEPCPRRRQPERDVPQRGDGGAGARFARRVRAAAPLDAVLAQRRRGRRRAAGRSDRWRRVRRHARGRRAALPPAGLGARRRARR